MFLWVVKIRMFYEQEKKYKTLEELKEAIEDYYNNKRIKEKLKGLTPGSDRSQSLMVVKLICPTFLGQYININL